ncbi:WD40-repeat-containing domain protein [Mycena rosella]|uniref:ASTRA-associated protein 1 n=1 Tax=Mycena rosella TaxID=1033263 RepID=A0AAD7CRW2_MYCRO|nr:WD40-repeat-containing domain protein [Mycena rosella]
MSSPAPAAPTHLLRSHSADVTALSFSDDNERLYSGDAAGRVVVTSTRALRPIVSWPAHTDGILGVQEWGARVLTHARDHKLHVWARVEDPPRVGASAAMSGAGVPPPTLCYSLDVNALNFCRFSLLPGPAASDGGEATALVALPNLVESAEADVWALPSRTRVHASVGTQRTQPMFSLGGREGMKTGLIMGLHLFRAGSSASSSSVHESELRLLCAYEDGSVVLRRFAGEAGASSMEGRGWDVVWRSKLHVEAIMAMRVSRDNRLALTVSADHVVGRYDLDADADGAGVVHRTTHAGNGCVALRDDGRVCAVGGWDGRIRLYTTKSMKPGCLAVEFARAVECAEVKDGEEDEEDEMSGAEREGRGRWLAAGAKDQRVSLWGLISFERV